MRIQHLAKTVWLIVLFILLQAIASPLVSSDLTISSTEFLATLEEAFLSRCDIIQIRELNEQIVNLRWSYLNAKLLFTNVEQKLLDAENMCSVLFGKFSSVKGFIPMMTLMKTNEEGLETTWIERNFEITPISSQEFSSLYGREQILKFLGVFSERGSKWRLLKEKDECDDGKYLHENKCLKCPFTCKKCSNQSTCTECKVDHAVMNRACFCQDEYHLYTNSDGDKSCIKLISLKQQKKRLCPDGNGLIKLNNKGSFCFKCSSNKCQRCSFTMNSNFKSNQTNLSIEEIIDTMFDEKCTRCESKFEQVSRKDNSTCISAKKDCKNCSACQTCTYSNKSCLTCDSTFSYLDSKSQQCITFEGAYSYRMVASSPSNNDGEDLINPIVLSSFINSISLNCKENESKVWNIVLQKYECISCNIQKCSYCDVLNTCQTCDSGYVLSLNKKLCQKCTVNHCQECEAGILTACAVCKNNFQLDPATKICTKQGTVSCADDEYYDTSAAQCKKCPAGCSECDYQSGVTCTDCESGYEILTSTQSSLQFCATLCSAGQYRNITTNACSPCPYGCASCTEFHQCQSCNATASYYLFSQISNSTFPQRVSEYQALLTQIINTSIPHANQFVQIVNSPNDRCLPKCPDNSYASLQYLGRNLGSKQFFEAGYQTQRFEESVESGQGVLFTCFELPNCVKASAFQQKCIQCADGFYFDPTKQQCTIYPTCSTLFTYFNPKSKKCTTCPSMCSNCAMTPSQDNPVCTQCRNGSILDPTHKFCVIDTNADNSSTTPSCKLANCSRCKVNRYNQEICWQCSSTSFLLKDSKCYDIRNQTNCKVGQYARFNFTSLSYDCQNCQSNCMTCNLINPYSQTQVPICTKCENNYSLSPKQSDCFANFKLTCSSNQSLQNFGAFYFCSSCDESCTEGCINYKPNNWCKNCKEGFKKIGNICVPLCPSGSKYSLDSHSCDFIDNSDIPLPSSFIEQSAIIHCPENSTYSPSLGSCVCDSYLNKFQINKCIKISVDSAAPNCSIGQFLELSSNSCKSCSYDRSILAPSCLICQDSFTCLMCAPGYFLDDSTSTCISCPSGCIKCTSNENCSECKIGQFMTFNVSIKKSTCSSTCDDGYLASLDSAYLWNLDQFPSISYSQFISNIQEELLNVASSSTLPFNIFNKNSALNFAPSGFTLISDNKIAASFLNQKIRMACVICKENCTVCPSLYFLDLKTSTCVLECPPEQSVLSRQCLSDINSDPQYSIVCESCFDLNNHNIQDNLVLKINGDAYQNLGSSLWQLESIECWDLSLTDKRLSEIHAIASNVLVIADKVKLTLEPKYLHGQTIFHFSFSYGTSLQKQVKIAISLMNHDLGGNRVRSASEIGIFSFMISQSESYLGTHSTLANLDQPEISFFFPADKFTSNEFVLSLDISFLSTGSKITKTISFKNSVAGQFSLDPYIPFVSTNDFMRLTFALTSKNTNMTYLITQSIELKHKSVDVEQLYTDLNTNDTQEEIQRIELLNLSLYQQMLLAEKAGLNALLNPRVDTNPISSTATYSDSSVLVGNYLAKNDLNLRSIELSLFDSSNSVKGLIYYSSCTNQSFGYLCKETQKQNMYFESIIRISLLKINNLFDSSTLSSSQINSLIKSLIILSRMNQNTSTIVKSYFSILSKIKQQSQAQRSDIMTALIYIFEMTERQKGFGKSNRDSSTSSENYSEQSINLMKEIATNLDQFSSKTSFIQVLRSKINLNGFSATLKVNQSSIVFPQSEGFQNVGFFTSSIVQGMLNLTNITSQGQPVTDSLYFNSFNSYSSNNKFKVQMKLTNTSTQKTRILSEKSFHYGCWNVISNSIGCDYSSITSESIVCECSGGEVQLIGIEIEDTENMKNGDYLSLLDLLDINTRVGIIVAVVGVSHLIVPLFVSLMIWFFPTKSKKSEKNKSEKYQQTKKSILNSKDLYEQTDKLRQVMAQVLAHNNLFQQTEVQEPIKQVPISQPAAERLQFSRNQTIEINEIPQVQDPKSMSESHFKYEFKCSAVGQTQQLSSLLQIPEQQSIIMKDENVKERVFVQIEINCFNIFCAILWGIKRPWNNIYSSIPTARLLMDSMCFILEVGFIVSLSRILGQIEINLIILVIHIISGKIVKFITQLRFASCCQIFYLSGLMVANYYALIYSKSDNYIPKSDFENWSYTIFVSVIMDEILRTISSIISVSLFLTNNPFKRVYDYQSCREFFNRRSDSGPIIEGKANSIIPTNLKDVSQKGSNLKFEQTPFQIEPISPISKGMILNNQCIIEDLDQIDFNQPRKEDTYGQMSPISHNTFMYDFVKDLECRVRNERRVPPAEVSVKKSESSIGLRCEEDDNRIGSLRQMKIQRKATFSSRFSKLNFEKLNTNSVPQQQNEPLPQMTYPIKQLYQQPCRTIELFSGENETFSNRVQTPPSQFREYHIGKRLQGLNSYVINVRKKRPDHFSVDNKSATHSVNQHNKIPQVAEKHSFEL